MARKRLTSPPVAGQATLTLVALTWTFVVAGIYAHRLVHGVIPGLPLLSVSLGSVTLMWIELWRRRTPPRRAWPLAAGYSAAVLARIALAIARQDKGADVVYIALALMLVGLLWWAALHRSFLRRPSRPLTSIMLWVGAASIAFLALVHLWAASRHVPFFPSGMMNLSVLVMIAYGYLARAVMHDAGARTGSSR